MKQWIKENKWELIWLTISTIVFFILITTIQYDNKKKLKHTNWQFEEAYDLGYLDGANDTVDAVNNQVAGRGNILEFYTNKFVYSTNYGKYVTKRMATNYFNK